MSNEFYTKTGNPSPNAPGSSGAIRDEFARIEVGFSKLPALSGKIGKVVVVNSVGTALEAVARVTGLAIDGSTINSTPIGLVAPDVAAVTRLTVVSSAPLALPMVLSEGALSGLVSPVGQTDAASKDYVDHLMLLAVTGAASTATSSLSGAAVVYAGTTNVFTVTDFDSFSTYEVNASQGSAMLSGATITFTAPASSGSVTLALTRNSLVRSVLVTVLQSVVAQPAVLTPANLSTGLFGPGLVLSSGAFASNGLPDSHLNSDWQLATDAAFTNVVQSSLASTVDKTNWSTTVAVNTVYYARVRHRGANNGLSAYSPTVMFSTATSFSSYIATPAATPVNFGDPFEGGFYKGLLWNQLVQSATSTLIGVGIKTFTVSDMTAVPLVYAGQMLEVRSRANPDNRMIGVVAGALGTNLMLNVTSVSGSGTFTDWSVMAQYRMISAPKSSGEIQGIVVSSAGETLPVACQTLTEGWLATLSMVAAGNATLFPAAHWARGLVIGGRSDWFIDARDGLELSARNLKPVTNANYVTANKAVGTFDYKNNGSFGDVTTTHGLNNNSSPVGAAYTTSNPSQTTATAFQTGGVEAFRMDLHNGAYSSCSAYGLTGVCMQHWIASLYGYQTISSTATSGQNFRAVRRSII